MPVSAGLTTCKQVDILQRLFPLVRQVDRDGSLTLSFFEYCYLAFKMSLGGGYKDMCADSRDAGFVKRHMLVIGAAISACTPRVSTYRNSS